MHTQFVPAEPSWGSVLGTLSAAPRNAPQRGFSALSCTEWEVHGETTDPFTGHRRGAPVCQELLPRVLNSSDSEAQKGDLCRGVV